MKKLISVLIAVILIISLFPVSVINAEASGVKYLQTSINNVPMYASMDTSSTVKGKIPTKGSVVKLLGTERKKLGLIGSKYETWSKILVDGSVTQSGSGGEFWVLKSNLTEHRHKDYKAGICPAPGCNHEVAVAVLETKKKHLQITVNNAPVRKAPYNDGEVVGRAKKGKLVTATSLISNYKLSPWYKLADGNYIYFMNVKEATEKKVQNESNNAANNSGSGSSGGSSGGSVGWNDFLFFQPEEPKQCFIHIYSIGKCINCGDEHKLNIKPLSDKAFKTTVDNVQEKKLPYENAASNGKVYAKAGSTVRVTGYATNAIFQKWYQTENGGWLREIENVALKKAYFSKVNHVFSDLDQTYTPTIVTEPSNAIITGKTWKTNNSAVATVDNNGKITPHSVGTATISCKIESVGASDTTIQFGVTVTDIANLPVWSYSNTAYTKALAIECSTYASLSYPSYEVENSESSTPLVYKKIKDKDDEPIEPETLKKLLNKRGFKHSVYNYEVKTQTTSPAVIASKLYRVGDKPKDVVFVIIEGSAALEGWQGNMQITGSSYDKDAGNYHKTFNDSANDLKTNLDNYIKKNKLNKPHVVITGHSRGAAAGNLLAEKLDNEEDKYGKVYAYLFAPPNATKTPHSYRNVYNICNTLDFVPYIPLSQTGWEFSKNGSVRSFNPKSSYYGEFKSIIEYQYLLSVYDRTPDYTWATSTPAKITDYMGGKWTNVKKYYEKQIVGMPLAACGTGYSYFYDGLAGATALKASALAKMGKHFLHHCAFTPISLFITTGAIEALSLTASFYDCHEMMTYHAAVLSDIPYVDNVSPFSIDASLNSSSGAELKEDEHTALYDFFNQGENKLMLEDNGWDIEDTSTWSGIVWDEEGFVTDIDISYMDLSGWFNAGVFPKLRTLNIDGNSISMLSTNGCTQLESLSCMANALTSVSLSECTALEELDCSFNQLTTLDLSNLSQLTELNCSGNSLNSINLNNTPSLSTMRCARNNLATLDVSQNTSLQELYLEGNNIIESENSSLMGRIDAINEKGGFAESGQQKYNSEYPFNEAELLSLTEFANSSDNLEKLDWDIEAPQTWSGVEWKIYDGEYHIVSVDFGGKKLEGDLNLPDAQHLSAVYCDNSSLSTLNLSGCKALNTVNCYNSGISELSIEDCEALTQLNCEENYLAVETVESSLNQIGLNTGIATYETQNIDEDETSFNKEEREELLSLLYTGNNSELLGWDADLPGSWDGIVWTKTEDEYRVNKIDFMGKAICGSLDLSTFDYLEDFDFSSTALESITLPDCISVIPEAAFSNSELKYIYMQNGITAIEDFAFANCSYLNTVVLPESVAKIHDNAFSGSENLKAVIFTGDAPIETGNDLFTGTSDEFTLYRFSETSWNENNSLLSMYSHSTISGDTVVLLNETPEIMEDGYYNEENNYCGDTINVVIASRGNKETVKCVLSVNGDSGKPDSITISTNELTNYMNVVSFEDINVQFVGDYYCTLKAFVFDASDKLVPASASFATRVIEKS